MPLSDLSFCESLDAVVSAGSCRGILVPASDGLRDCDDGDDREHRKASDRGATMRPCLGLDDQGAWRLGLRAAVRLERRRRGGLGSTHLGQRGRRRCRPVRGLLGGEALDQVEDGLRRIVPDRLPQHDARGVEVRPLVGGVALP